MESNAFFRFIDIKNYTIIHFIEAMVPVRSVNASEVNTNNIK